MVKSLPSVRVSITDMKWAISLRLKVPVEFSREVSKLSRFFSRCIPIEIDPFGSLA